MYFFSPSLRILPVFIFFLFITSFSKAQQPEAYIREPSNGTQNVSINPAIKITTNYKIDLSSITWDYPSVDYDSTLHFVTDPTILLVEKDIVDLGLPDSLLQAMSITGTYVVVGDTTLMFIPSIPLTPNTQYIVKAIHLRVIKHGVTPGMFDTVNIDKCIPSMFTIIPPVHKVENTSLGIATVINCKDTIQVRFNRKIDSLSTLSGQLLSIERLDSVQMMNDSIAHQYTSSVSSTKWIDPSDSSIAQIIASSSFIPGQTYYLSIKTSYLSGDTLDDYYLPFYIQPLSKFNIEMIALNPLDTLSNLCNTTPSGTYYTSDDTVTFAAISHCGDYNFIRWECPQLPQLHEKSDTYIRIVSPCEKYGNYEIKAVYAKKDSVTIIVKDTTGIAVEVYQFIPGQQRVFIGTEGTYRLASDQAFMIVAKPDSGYGFGHWGSDHSSIEDNPAPAIFVPNLGNNIVLKPWPKLDVEPAVNFNLCTDFYISESPNLGEYGDIRGGGLPSDGIVIISPDPCYSSGDHSELINVSAEIVDNCFEIWGYEISGPGISESYYFDEGIPSVNLQLPTTNPGTKVFFWIFPTTVYDLTIEVDIQTPRQAEIGWKKDVTVETWRILRKQPVLVGRNESVSVTYKMVCNQQVKLVELHDMRSEGFSFVKWHDPTQPTPYMYPTPVNKSSFEFIMDEDKKAKAIFKEHFRLQRIGVYRDDNREDINWFTTKEFRSRMIDDIEIFDNFGTGFGTKINFEFNDPVDEMSIPDDKITGWDLSDRINYSDPLLYRTKMKYISSQITVSNNIIEWHPKTYWINTSLPKGQQFSFDVNGAIKNTSSENLYNPGTWIAETETPGFRILLKKIKVYDDHEDFLSGCGEIATMSRGVFYKSDGDSVVRTRSNIPDTDCWPQPICEDDVYNICSGGTKNVDAEYQEMISINETKNSEEVGIALSSTEIDDFGTYGSQMTILASALIAALSVAFKATMTGAFVIILSVGFAVFILYGLLIGFGILSSKNTALGGYNFIFDWKNNRWGAEPRQRNRLRRNGRYVEYELEVQLKKDNTQIY